MMNPHYYLMKSKKILRLEEETSFDSLHSSIKENVIDATDIIKMNQEQANWRVVLFRDEIMEMDEYQEWMATAPVTFEEEYEYDLIAN